MSPEELFQKADVALQSSALLLQSGDTDGACNRAYYAMFDAARAALMVAGLADLSSIKTHSGLIAVFGQHLVKTGRASIELGKAINKVEDLRLIADYRGDAVSSERAAWALQEARSFVEQLRKL